METTKKIQKFLRKIDFLKGILIVSHQKMDDNFVDNTIDILN